MEKSEKWYQKNFGMSKAEVVMGMRGGNEVFNHINKGLPNDAMITDWVNQMYAERYDKEFAGLGGMNFGDVCFSSNNKNGYAMFLALIYEKFSNFVGSIFTYNDEFIDDLGISKYKFEKMLIEAGSLALVVDKGNYFALQYQMLEKDVYNCPTKIKIVNANKKFNDKVYNEGEFQIIEQNQNQWNKIVENGVFLTEAYKIGCQINDEITRGQDHYILLQNRSFEANGPILAQALDEFSRSSDTVLSILPKNVATKVLADPNGAQDADVFDQFSKSLLKLEYKERMAELFDQYQNFMAEAFKYLGWDANMNSKKKERQITGEIDVQNQIPESQRIMMLELREWALNQANKKFGTNWSVELNDRLFGTEEEQDKEESEENN